jgi:hypothetical protein
MVRDGQRNELIVGQTTPRPAKHNFGMKISFGSLYSSPLFESAYDTGRPELVGHWKTEALNRNRR